MIGLAQPSSPSSCSWRSSSTLFSESHILLRRKAERRLKAGVCWHDGGPAWEMNRTVMNMTQKSCWMIGTWLGHGSMYNWLSLCK